MLATFIEKKDSSRIIRKDKLTQELLAFLIDDRSDNNGEIYFNLISQFIIENEKNDTVNNALARIKEGSILYIGLNHNISETGSVRKPLTLYLATEILFSLLGLNGEIHKQLALDFYDQVKAANTPSKKITLCYFSEVKREIDNFFRSAEAIVDGKNKSFDTVAMKTITNGCLTAGDIRIKQADFFHALKFSYGINEDENQNYYSEDKEKYNLESLSIDSQYFEAAKFISHINKLRKGQLFDNNLEAEHLIVTNSGNILRFSKEHVKQLKTETGKESICDYAVSVDRITNLLWYKLGKGFGRKAYPTNVDAVLKARILLASRISQSISKVYSETKEMYIAGEITEDQLKARIITLREKPTVPEELQPDNIDDAIDFSLEYITRYEEEYKNNILAHQEIEQRLRDIELESERELSRKDDLITQKSEIIREIEKKTKDLEIEVSELRKEKEEHEKKLNERKNKFLLIKSIVFYVIISALLVCLAAFLCIILDSDFTNIICTIVGLLSLFASLINHFKNISKKHQLK